MFRKLHLLSSTAFANNNPGIQTMARYLGAPNPSPLIAAARLAEGQSPSSIDSDEMMKRSPDIAAMVAYWDKTDAIIEGYEAVKACGETYLPSFAEEKKADYDIRLNLTKFTNIYRDIVEGLASKPFEEEVSLLDDDKTKVPEQIEKFAEDVDGEGNNLTAFLSSTFYNGINSAIDWIFVDYPTVDTTVIRTKADEKAAGIQPFWTHILGRNILWVKTQKINGKQELSYIKIYEPGIGERDRVRIFERVNGVVSWQLWEKTDNLVDGKFRFILLDDGVLTIDVIPLVPFYTGRRDGASWKFFPAMQDAADLQIQLYQDESALKFIKTMAGYPMLAANGMRPELEADGKTPKKVAIGPMRLLWGVPNGDGGHGEWKFIEPNAHSMKFLQEENDKTKQDLRELGRQPLTATSGNLTVITTAVAAGKARSAVSAWALGLKNAAENALLITCKWLKISDYKPQVNVYNEFDNFTDGNADLTELGSARKNGDLSRETYWNELKRRKVLSPEFEAEDEEERLLNEIPGDPDLEDEDDGKGKPPVKLPGKKKATKSKQPAA
ncbi:putative structural protein [Rhizobium phage vB_RglS_P106B]|uniref:Putative structural protein n=1 Tax=Rhizobium phage vB_RglS_P106B TaxID=1458697 RepID=W6E8D1_9CAUD|nr:portal protein [Rhizobium phage vB_RglS_P106B]AHJ10685.1 putative structural protein [Rhizobium phage vB_RglS_P106B]